MLTLQEQHRGAFAIQKIEQFIHGAHLEGASGRTLDVVNPATGEVRTQVVLTSQDEMAIASAGAAQPAWAPTHPQKRARVLMVFVGLLHRAIGKLAETLSREQGKTIPDAKGMRRSFGRLNSTIGFVTAFLNAKLKEHSWTRGGGRIVKTFGNGRFDCDIPHGCGSVCIGRVMGTVHEQLWAGSGGAGTYATCDPARNYSTS